MPAKKRTSSAPRRGRRGSRGAESLAISAITQRIRDGFYAPGQHLSEAQLSADLKLSRNTVREVLRRLAAGGLITFEANKGARVVRLDRQDVAGLFQLREVIEGLAAALSAANINIQGHRDRASEMLQEINALRAGKAGGVARYVQHNARFHELLMDMSQNKYLVKMAGQLHVPALRPSYFELMDEAALQQSLSEHEEIILAVLDGDTRAAEAHMRAHVKGTARAIHRMSDDLFSQVYGH